jgi:uncharacterized protein (DUF302 family)
MKCLTFVLSIAIFFSNFYGVNVMAADGLITVPSEFAAKETADRLVSEVTAKGMTVFARIDHAAGAAAAGLELRPTELLIFGSAKAGTPLMQAVQAAGIDLPLKAVTYEDAQGNVWISYNDPRWLAKRHGLGLDVETIVTSMSSALEAVVAKATRRP